MRAAAALLLAAALGCAPRMATGPIPLANRPDWKPLRHFLDSAVAAGAAPGIVVAVSWPGHRYVYGTGRLGVGIRTRPNNRTVYDLASLTKVVGLTTAVMWAVEEGRLDLDAPASRYLPAFQGPGTDSVTIRLLLAHASGLPAWRPLYLLAYSRPAVLAVADSTPLDTLPGARFTYSDIGAILLTQAVESVYGERIDSLLARRLFTPLGMRSTAYNPPVAWLPRVAPTEFDSLRNRMIRGQVHDENAWRMDGVSGHAGIFSTGDDLLTFGEWWVAHASDSVVHAFTVPQHLPPGSPRALGWEVPTADNTGSGYLSAGSVGHTGFTGTSIWMDPARQVVIVVLANRVHPTRANERFAGVRRGVGDRVLLALDPGLQGPAAAAR
ncbi:MAG TPA: serine hydrolase domain-containing protein [Gemmatimonadales bacterium]|nr:serine hydrolase domain-containing protein [Gemmatimonadales bacterium]HRZ08830.1 serine hydrolase domain-containing protein [Gemmatimonadales bacterium]